MAFTRNDNMRSYRLPAQIGGWSLIVAALLFMAVFGYLAVTFNYPAVLDGPAGEVLPRLLTLGAQGRAVWALYGMLPLLLIPAALGAQAALGPRAPWTMRAAVVFAGIAAGTMMLGLLRWPSVHWALARAYVVAAGDPERRAIAAVFDGLNLYLGNYLGEFVGELALNLFFLLAALGQVRSPHYPRWSGPAGMVAGLAGLVAMWRNVTPAVDWLMQIENYLLPAWMIILGVLLIRCAMPRAEETARESPEA